MDESVKSWFALRVAAIREKITVYDVLRRNGVTFKHNADRVEQIPCPFHGKDENPSARVYPDSETGPSHVWCFVCREKNWDAIGLWKKYSGETKKFHQILTEIEQAYALDVPEAPKGPHIENNVKVSESAKAKEDFETLHRQCESRLIQDRDLFHHNNDMKGYLTIGSILDKLLYKTSEGQLSFTEGHTVLTQLLTKIGAKVGSFKPLIAVDVQTSSTPYPGNG